MMCPPTAKRAGGQDAKPAGLLPRRLRHHGYDRNPELLAELQLHLACPGRNPGNRCFGSSSAVRESATEKKIHYGGERYGRYTPRAGPDSSWKTGTARS